jgi:hypothetical protein
MRRPKPLRIVIAGMLATALAACAGATADGPGSLLTIVGSAFAPPTILASGRAPALVDPTTGDPASLSIGVYAFYISPNNDCSDPVLVQDYGPTAEMKDFVSAPVLFSGSPAAGSYPCVAMKMSDVISVVPSSSFGDCVAGVSYPGDIYRDGETDWVDVNMNPIVGTGSDSFPADDHVVIFMTRDTAAALARGISGNQLIPLNGDLMVPGQSTFYWHGEGSVVSQGGQCGVNPGRPEFR